MSDSPFIPQNFDDFPPQIQPPHFFYRQRSVIWMMRSAGVSARTSPRKAGGGTPPLEQNNGPVRENRRSPGRLRLLRGRERKPSAQDAMRGKWIEGRSSAETVPVTHRVNSYQSVRIAIIHLRRSGPGAISPKGMSILSGGGVPVEKGFALSA